MGDRLRGWRPTEVGFRATYAFDERSSLRDLTAWSDRDLMEIGETPSPRYSLQHVDTAGGELTIEAAFTDWSVIGGAQDVLFRGKRPSERDALRSVWSRSTTSIIRCGRPDGFSHHVCAHGTVISADGYLVSLERQRVSNQAGRVSLTFEEQLDVPHVSTRWWPERLVRIAGDKDPVDALRRGLREELGIDGKDARITVLGAAVEDASIAFNVIGLVEVDETLAQIRRRYERAADRDENRLLPTDETPRLEDVVSSWLGSPDDEVVSEESGLALRRPRRWHASSLLRAQLAVAHLVGSASGPWTAL